MMPNNEWKSTLQNVSPATSVQPNLMTDGLESLKERLEARRLARANSAEPTTVFSIATPNNCQDTGRSEGKPRRVKSNDGSLMPGERGSNHRRRMMRRRHQRPSDPGPIIQGPPKGILKKQTSASDATDKVSRKRVSFSDSLSRWNSEGSGLHLKSLIAKQEASMGSTQGPKGNCQWGTEKTKKSSSAIGLSLLGKQVDEKHRAPLRPKRRGSVKAEEGKQQAPFLPERRGSIDEAQKTLSANVFFQTSLADFQSRLAMEMASHQNNYEESENAPTRPTRRASEEIDCQVATAIVCE